jgi:chitin disaccharide deacetylase
MTKRLIVNGDDFGISPGVNAGLVRAHREGILSSASLMVDTPYSAEAARLGAEQPALGVGVHVVIDSCAGLADAEAEVERQVERFVELAGRLPTHIDSHRNVHQDERLLPAFLAVARRHRLPLRGSCDVPQISSFYGQWNGETHAEQITAASLVSLLAEAVGDGVSELCCHPGYVDGHLVAVSSYTLERQTELATLCDPVVAAALDEEGIHLATFREVGRP